MWRWICLVCLALGLVPAEARKGDLAAVDSLMAAASDALLSHKQRVKVLRDAIKQDDSGRAMHALGRIYMEKGSPVNMQDAERWIQRAIKRERDNADYHATYAEYLWRIGRRTTSITFAKRAIERDPNHVMGLYWAGRFEMWQMTRYLEGERVDYNYGPQFGDEVSVVTFSTEQYGIEARDAAVGYLTRAVAADPDHWPSRKLLGLVYYEGRMPQDLIALFEDYVERHPKDARVRFFVGLGYQATDQMDQAYTAYREGLVRMSPREQQFMMAVFLMQDKKALKDADTKLPDEAAIRRFWTGRDPLFLTPFNERLLEHCRRVAYVNLRFGEALKGIEGWTTDKGQAYIRYGHPVAVVARPAEVDTGLDLPGYMQDYMAWQAAQGRAPVRYEHRKELWRYEGFTLIFENTDTRDAWTFRVGWLDTERNPLGFSNFVERVPEHYQDPYTWERYDVPFQIAQFRGTGGKSRVEVYYALAGEEVSHSDDRPGLKSVDVRQGLFLFDAAWDTLRRDVVRVKRMPFVVYDAIREGYLFAGHQLEIEPGEYYLAAEVEDQASKTLGTFRETLPVRQFGYDSLQVSSLLLARRIVEREDRPFGRARYMVLSNPIGQCERTGQAVFYFEVYNLTRNEYGATHYELTYQVRKLAEGETEETADWATAVSYKQKGSRPWEPHQMALDLDGTMPGLRAFRVVVKDLQSGTEAMASTTFRVMW